LLKLLWRGAGQNEFKAAQRVIDEHSTSDCEA
jgi:hypothetical protein